MKKVLVLVVGSLFAVASWAAPPQEQHQPPTHDATAAEKTRPPDTAERQKGQPNQVRGTLVAWDEAGKSVTVKDQAGKERKFVLDADTKVSKKPTPGQMVTIVYTQKDGQNLVRQVLVSPPTRSQGKQPTKASAGTQPAPTPGAAPGGKTNAHEVEAGQKGRPGHVLGTVVTWNEVGRSVTVKDRSGKERTFALAADTEVKGKPAPGQTVTIVYAPGEEQNVARQVHVSPQPPARGKGSPPAAPETQPAPTTPAPTPAPTAAPRPVPSKK